MYFKPSIKLTLVLLLLALVFVRLGLWQMERKSQKEALFDQFGNAPILKLEQAVQSESLFARVEAYGQYDTERHVLLDNKILNGRAGVQVLTPFTLPGGKRLLVNRGWLPLAPDRQTLPEVLTDRGPKTISGILNRLPGGGPRIGEADVLATDRWPQLVTYFEFSDVEAALGASLLPWQLQLDPADDSGFKGRQWKAAVMGPEVHGAYALQWFALALASLIIWITLSVRRARHHQPPAADREDE